MVETFLPHAVCYLWDARLLGLHAITDILIGLSYVVISCTLGYLVFQARKDLPFHWVLLAFGAFIVACGATHFMEVWTLWEPRYWLAGGVKVVTALASLATALVLPPLVPRALSLVRAAEATRQHAAALRASEARFRSLLEAAPDAIVIVDRAGRIVLVNQQAERLFDYRRDELLGQPVEALLPHHLRDAHLTHREQYHADPRTRPMGVDLDLAARKKDGSEFTAEISLSPLDTPEGVLVTAVARDVTERKRAEAQRLELVRAETARAEAEATQRRASFLAEASAILSSSLDYETTLQSIARLAVPSLADVCAVDVVTEPGRTRRLAVVHVDPAKEPLVRELRERHGFNPAGLHGVPRVIRTGRPAFVPRATEEHLAAAAVNPEQHQLLQELGLYSWIIVPLSIRGRMMGAITLVMSDSRRTYTMAELALAEDLARRAAMAMDNAQLYREAQDANRAKDDFLATLSHELRTPLNAVFGWTRMLQSGVLDAATSARAIEAIARNARAQTQLIEDLLDVSRIVTGKTRLDVQLVDPVGPIEAAVDAVQPAADAKGIAITKVLNPGAGPILGDADRLQQIVWNLLVNAVKFTPKEGGIHVSLQRVNSHVEIQIRDTGPGIPDSLMMPQLFERFRQGPQSRVHGGLGIGLALVRHLAELHGGTARAANAGPEGGAILTVELPVAAVRAASTSPQIPRVPEAGSPAPLEGIRVLAVDDDRDSIEMVRTILDHAGAVTEVASSVAHAVERLAEFRPDVILSDLEMPDEDGYSLIRRIRGLPPERGGLTPVAAVTAYGRVEDRVRTLSAGFDTHLAKPVDPAELVAVVASLARGARH